MPQMALAARHPRPTSGPTLTVEENLESDPAVTKMENLHVTWAGLIWKNLLRRRGRTALTSAGVAIGVGLIVALLSIAAGVHNTANDLIHVGRADFGLFQRDVTDLTKSLLPDTLAHQIRKRPGVNQTANVYLWVGNVEGHSSFIVFVLERHG